MINSLYIQFKSGDYTILKLDEEDRKFVTEFLDNYRYGEQGILRIANQNTKHYNRCYINVDDASYICFTEIPESMESQHV